MNTKDGIFKSTSILPSPHDHMTSFNEARVRDIGARNGNLPQLRPARTLGIRASSFFTELKRRKVYKVEATYAVFSWLLIQAASIFLPTFDAPPCFMKAVVLFLAIGFVISAILSWVFDITPQGIKRTTDIAPNEAIEIASQLEAQARQEFIRGYLSALVYAGLGDKTNAVDYLKQEYLKHDNIHIEGMSVDAMLEELQCRPRFEFAEKPALNHSRLQ